MIKVAHLSGPYALSEREKSNETLLKFVSKVLFLLFLVI